MKHTPSYQVISKYNVSEGHNLGNPAEDMSQARVQTVSAWASYLGIQRDKQAGYHF